jgi:hypothetical protein
MQADYDGEDSMSSDKKPRRVSPVARLRDDAGVDPESFDRLVEGMGHGETKRSSGEPEKDPAALPEGFDDRAVEGLEQRRERYAAARRVAKAGGRPRLYE